MKFKGVMLEGVTPVGGIAIRGIGVEKSDVGVIEMGGWQVASYEV